MATWVADVIDPVSGETATITAETEEALDLAIEEHLGLVYADQPVSDNRN